MFDIVVPKGIRTPVAAVKGQCPRPLDDGDLTVLKYYTEIFNKKIICIKADVRSKKINNIFKTYKIYSVIHFAGLKTVKESEKRKKSYYDNNVNGTKNLLNYMVRNGCYKIIFSSSFSKKCLSSINLFELFITNLKFLFIYFIFIY